MNINQILLSEIPKMRPIEFTGLAKLLGVEVVKLKDEKTTEQEFTSTETAAEGPGAQNQKYEPRPFADVLGDVMARFSRLNRQRKREIVKLVKKSNSNKRDGI